MIHLNQNCASDVVYLWLGQKSLLPIKYYNRFKNFQITQTVVLTMIRQLTQCAVHEAGHYRRRIGGVAVCWQRRSSRRLCVCRGQLITAYWQRNCSACAELGKVNNNWRLHNTASRGRWRSRCPTHPLAEISPLHSHTVLAKCSQQSAKLRQSRENPPFYFQWTIRMWCKHTNNGIQNKVLVI